MSAGSDRRRAAATATTGAGLTFAGGVLRHQGLKMANRGQIPGWTPKRPLKSYPATALVRRGARGRGRYAVGALLGLAGAPALAVGGHDLVVRRKPVEKLDDRRKVRRFVQEGLEGTQDAVNQRVASAREAPPQARALPVGIGLGAGSLGSLGAHRALDRTKAFRGARHTTRAGITATVGTAAAAASFPLARAALRHNRDYEVTPAGVRRRKLPIKRPSSAGVLVDQKKLSRREYRRQTVGKVHNPHNLTGTTSRGTPRKVHWREGANDHAVCGLDGAFGRGTGPFAEHYGEITCVGCQRVMRIRKALSPSEKATERRQRAAIYAAGATPVIGPFAGAHAAAHFAAPGDRKRAAARQFTGQVGGGAAGAVIGGYGLAAAAKPGSRIERGAQRTAAAHREVTERVGRLRPVSAIRSKLPKSSRMASTKARALETKVARPLARRPVAAAVGAWGGAKIGGFIGSTSATNRTVNNSRDYRLKHPVVKLQQTPMPVEQRQKLARKKRIAAASSTVTGMAGLGALGLLAAGKHPRFRHLEPQLEHKRNALLAVGAGVGGANSLNFAGVLRREAHQDDPRHKGVLVHKSTMELAARYTTGGMGLADRVAPKVTLRKPRSAWDARKIKTVRGARGLLARGINSVAVNPTGVIDRGSDLLAKADRNREPLTRMRADQAAALVRRHGDAGPLPNTLSRPERMQAYEARYVHAGGHKAEKWQRRADTADKVKMGGLAGATAGGAAYLALRHPAVMRRMGSHAGRVKHAADTATIGAATVSGAGELYASHARRRRSSYSNSKAGVAASALRRMRDYQS